MINNAGGRSTFRQADIERLIRAARKAGAVIDVDLRTLKVRITAIDPSAMSEPHPDGFAPDGAENWDEGVEL